MSKLEVYITEYMAIVGHLVKKFVPEKGQHFLWVDKAELCRLLDRNAYEPAARKLKIWRDLRWIEAQPGRLTKRVTQGGRVVYMVKIDLGVYEAWQGINGRLGRGNRPPGHQNGRENK